MPPIVSVVIPVFNRRNIVSGAIQSALGQDIDGLEVVVVDNCSTDGTWEFLQTLRDPRLKIFRNTENLGLFGNFTRCVELATGKYCTILCSDDRLCPGFLKCAVERLETTPAAVMVCGSGRLINTAGRTVRHINRDIKPGLYRGGSTRHAYFWYTGAYGVNIFNYPSGMMLRRDIVIKELPFRADLGDPGDVDMWLRCLKHGDFLVTDIPACDVIWHDNQLSCENRKAGVHVPDLIRFAQLHVGGEEDKKFLRNFRMLLGGSAAVWALRNIVRGQFTRAWGVRTLGPNVFDLVAGTAIRIAFRALKKFGITFGKFLQPAH